MWGRTLDPKFIATTMAWLQTATPEERESFRKAVGSSSGTLVPSRTPVFPDRAYTGHKRPWTARSRMQNDANVPAPYANVPAPATAGEYAADEKEYVANENGVLGKFLRQAAPPTSDRPMSARARVEPSAVSAATRFARARAGPSPRTNGPQRNLTPRTPPMLITPTMPKGTASPRPSPRPPPICVDSPSAKVQTGPAIGIKGTQVVQMQIPPPPTASPRTGTPRAKRMLAPCMVAPSQVGPTVNDLHAKLQKSAFQTTWAAPPVNASA